MVKKLKLQNLPAKQAHFCLQICHFLNEIDFELNEKKCIIALSGGADSTALLIFLKLMQEKYNLSLYALHIDHALREESAKEAKTVKKLCKKLEIPCEILRIDVQKKAKTWKKGIEESARIIRYENFENKRQELDFDCIMLGHHLNDLAEDVLMRQVRGTSLEQSFGMQAIDNTRKICRPFLLTEKKELLDLLNTCSIKWVEDLSNLSNVYMRNRVRNILLPLFLEENPAFLKNIKNNWKQGQIERKYWQKKIETYSSFVENSSLIKIDRINFTREEEALRLRILAKIIKKLSSQPQAEQLFKLDKIICAKESNKEMYINKKLKIHISKKFISFEKY